MEALILFLVIIPIIIYNVGKNAKPKPGQTGRPAGSAPRMPRPEGGVNPPRSAQGVPAGERALRERVPTQAGQNRVELQPRVTMPMSAPVAEEARQELRPQTPEDHDCPPESSERGVGMGAPLHRHSLENMAGNRSVVRGWQEIPGEQAGPALTLGGEKLDAAAMRQAVLLAEVLGAPVSRRRTRRDTARWLA